MWEIKEEKPTPVLYITSFQGRLLEYNGGGALIGDGALIDKKHVLPGALLDTGR